MTTKEANDKIRSVKALQGKTVADCVEMPEFLEELVPVVQEQVETRKAYRNTYHEASKGKSFGLRHVVDSITEAGLMDPEKIRNEYREILNGASALPANQRKYIYQLASVAFRNLIRRFAIAEFPELKEYFDGHEKNYKS